ncbi:unnamed protein product [Hymenolepis diminuta]|uniref:C3H1-type domain-containing protein n=1 Tax=Hymenolepis diminuta TaxID=6216 RepID=A0A0R3SAC9_HYMDI|nr:unnamed protein product [Hymenolepis diminuta]
MFVAYEGGMSRGRRYYCDYCGTSFPDSLVNRRNHLNGVRHIQLRQEHLGDYEDPADILAREQNKRPCVNFQRTGACQYGASCRYSHLTHEEVVRLQALAEPIQDPIQAILEVEAVVRIRREKHLSSFLPWGYNLSELPPSVRRSLDNQPIQ